MTHNEQPTSDPIAWPMTLSGRGLVLREWDEADLPAMKELFDETDIAANTNIPSPFDPAGYLAMIRTMREKRVVHLAITVDGGDPLGLLYVGVPRGELGYVVGKRHRRQGLALRALQTATEFGHDTLGHPVLSLSIGTGNAPSQAVARAADYRLTDDARVEATSGLGKPVALETWVHHA